MKSAFLLSKGLLSLYDKQNNTWLLVDMEFLFSCSTRHLTRSLRSLLSYRVEHSKRNSISTRAHVLFSICFTRLKCGAKYLAHAIHTAPLFYIRNVLEISTLSLTLLIFVYSYDRYFHSNNSDTLFSAHHHFHTNNYCSSHYIWEMLSCFNLLAVYDPSPSSEGLELPS